MLTSADALPLAVERAGDAVGDRRQCGQSRTAVLSPTLDRPQIGRDAFPPQSSWRAPGSHSTSSLPPQLPAIEIEAQQ